MPRIITPSNRLVFWIFFSGFPASRIKSARFPTSIVPNSELAPRYKAASRVPAFSASYGVSPAETRFCNSSWAEKPGTIKRLGASVPSKSPAPSRLSACVIFLRYWMPRLAAANSSLLIDWICMSRWGSHMASRSGATYWISGPASSDSGWSAIVSFSWMTSVTQFQTPAAFVALARAGIISSWISEPPFRNAFM